MNTVKEHYDGQLAAIYSWMSGGSEAAIERNRELFRQLEIEDVPRGLAIDLGAGAGFQSVPLAELGFSVVALDFSAELLAELRERAGRLPIRVVQDDLLNFDSHVNERSQVVVCMGDTLTHLESFEAVGSLLARLGPALGEGGMLVLTFRDYVSVEPRESRRFIPVRSDESTILTCYLEYHEEAVEVYDLLYRKEGEQWKLSISSYPKLRLDRDWVGSRLLEAGLRVVRNEIAQGMVLIVARKD